MFDADEILGWVKHQVELGSRRPGSAGDHQNEQFLQAKLEEFGLECVRREPIPITRWEATTSTIDLLTGPHPRPVECFPIPYAAFTPQEGIEAPLRWVDPRRLFQPSGSWEGTIVVTEIGFPPFDIGLMSRICLGRFDPDGQIDQVRHPATFVRLGWHLYHEAVKRGAVGFIGILRDQPGGSCRMYAPYGFREKDILDKPLPGFWAGKRDGAALREAAQSHATARIVLTGVKEPGITHNVVGEIPGATDEVVVLSCHHDSPFASPVEDASGVSVVLALAKHLNQARNLRRRVIVLFSAGHFYGSVGTRSFIRDHLDVVRRTAIEISIEHIALEAAEDEKGELVPTGQSEPTGIFVPLNRGVADHVLGAVRAHDVKGVILLPAEGPLGDYPPTDGGDWWEAGVPVINYICNPVYLLTDDDAMRWVDKERLPRVAETFVDVLGRLDGMPVAALRAVDSRAYQLLMKALRRVVSAKTTALGLRPVT